MVGDGGASVDDVSFFSFSARLDLVGVPRCSLRLFSEGELGFATAPSFPSPFSAALDFVGG